MVSFLRHLRPALVGLFALMFSAGLVFAGDPPASHGLGVAGEHAGKTVPVAAPNEDEQDESKDESEAEEPDDADAGDAGDHCTLDLASMTDEEIAAANHGAVVCSAAHMDTPDGYANHGAFVSEWAKKNHGQANKPEKPTPAHGSADHPGGGPDSEP